jgi:carboxyl-terminal processing protease
VVLIIVDVWKNVVKKLDLHLALAWGIVLLLTVLVLILAVAYLYERSRSSNRESIDLYAEALEAVEENYINRETIDPREQTYGAIKGMLGTLGDDRTHTQFLTPEEVGKNREGFFSSTYVGIGVQLENRDDEVVAAAPIDGSPAKEARIEPEGVVIAVDGESVQGENIVEVTEKLEGAEGLS